MLEVSTNVGNKARPILDSEAVLNKIREALLQKNISLVYLMQKHDRGNQLISFDLFVDEISNRVAVLSRDEISVLANHFKPNQNNQVNYFEIANSIMNHRIQTPANFIENIEDLRGNISIEMFRNKLIEELTTFGISIRALFRRIDLDNDEYLSFKEFFEYATRLIGNSKKISKKKKDFYE